MEWIAKLLAGPLVAIFKDTIVTPILQAFLKSKDVDLEKFKTAQVSTEQLAVAVLDANVRHAAIKSQYALTVLNWWPFRVVLWMLLAVCAAHFCAIIIDSTWFFIFGCWKEQSGDLVKFYGDACSWNIPPIRGNYGEYEKEYILFFIIAKPVDTLIGGAFGALSQYLRK